MNKNENEFPSFPKIPRLAKQINEYGTWLRAGSRNRWLTQGEAGDSHFQVGGGEWFGSGIQRGYGMKGGQAIEEALHDLRRNGSKAAPGFMNPEGIVLRFHVNGVVYKAFCEDDGLPKGLATMANDPY